MRKNKLRTYAIFCYLLTVAIASSAFAGGAQEYDPCKERVDKARNEACPPVTFEPIEECPKCPKCPNVEKCPEIEEADEICEPTIVEKIVEKPVEKIIDNIIEVEVVVREPIILKHNVSILVGYGPDGIEAGDLYYDQYYRDAKTHYNVIMTLGYGHQFRDNVSFEVQASTNRTISTGLKFGFN